MTARLSELVVNVGHDDGHRYQAELHAGGVVLIRRNGELLDAGRWSARGHIVGVEGAAGIEWEAFAALEQALAGALVEAGEHGDALLAAQAVEA